MPSQTLVLEVMSWLAAGAVAVPSAVFFVECVVGALARRRAGMAVTAGDFRPRIAVLVPAHDEALGIARTIEALRAELRDGDTLLVVADNCKDDTASLARGAGATVVERNDADRRGKGYALAFGLDHLAAEPPDAVVIVDADCRVEPSAIERIARLAVARDRPVQADYVLEPAPDASGLSVVSALAFIVKNRARPRGLWALGLPCLLTGTGMAFPWRVIRMAPPTEGHLVEDMVMGLDLAVLGHPPLLCPDAHVTSDLPVRVEAAHTQRRRWEHGHLATLLAQSPRLLWRGLVAARLGLLALALDLAVPPLSLLVLSIVATLLLTLVLFVLGAPPGPLVLCLLSLAGIVAGVVAAWLAYGREVVSAKQLLAIPRYVLWKLPLYFAFLTRGRHGAWERTERK